MFTKFIDGLNEFLYNAVTSILVGLGIYAAYEILFGLDISRGASIPLVLFVFFVSYLITGEDPKIDAVPVMIVQGGRPVNIKGIRGGE